MHLQSVYHAKLEENSAQQITFGIQLVRWGGRHNLVTLLSTCIVAAVQRGKVEALGERNKILLPNLQ